MFYLIYRTHNTINGRHYTGSHMTENLDDGYLGSGNVIREAVALYGREAFKREVLFMAFDEASMEWAEEQLVETVYQNPTSYNLVPGGGRPPRATTESARKGQATKKRIGTFTPPPIGTPEVAAKAHATKRANGYSMPEAARRAIGEKNRIHRTGKPSWNKGVTGFMSPEGVASIAEENRRRRWITNGTISRHPLKTEPIPSGWREGKAPYKRHKTAAA